MALQLPYNPNNGAPLQPLQPLPLVQAAVPPLFAKVVWTPKPRPPSIPIVSRPRTQSFTFFPLLPPELRLKIWSYTLPRRVIEIRSWGSGRYCPIKFSITPHRRPVIFRICRESRTEALRLYQLVEVGVSAAQLRATRTYVDWKYHPTNPHADPEFTVGTAPLPYAIPYPPVKVYLNYDHDILYLGPEFHLQHLHDFLTGMGAGHELPGVQRIALCHKLWEGSPNGRWDELRQALFALKTRPVMEVIIVPDDHVGALEDRWYYERHEIRLLEPDVVYHFRPGNGEKATTVVENLGEWFGRLWGGGSGVGGKEEVGEGEGERNAGEAAEKREVPKVCIKTIRRNGRTMANFRDGLWGIQEAMGDMRYWKTWNPPEMAKAS